MILGLDVWEGSLEINEQLLLENGVRYLIPRLNDMNGGHHLDGNFYSQWDQSAGFLRTPYFVYNPWVSGAENAKWLLANLPRNAPRRLFVDIEVRKDGYSPDVYANEVQEFIDILLAEGFKPCIYTGAWFLPCLSRWPSNVDYWWARYPYDLYPPVATPISWQDLSAKVELVGWYPDPMHICPGTVRLWQCSADRYIPSGTERATDINAWNGTLEELEDWWGVKFPSVIEEPIPGELIFEALVDNQNVRSGPSLTAPIIGHLVVGQVLSPLNIAGLDAWAEIAPGQWAAVKLGSRRYLRAI